MALVLEQVCQAREQFSLQVEFDDTDGRARRIIYQNTSPDQEALIAVMMPNGNRSFQMRFPANTSSEFQPPASGRPAYAGYAISCQFPAPVDAQGPGGGPGGRG